MLPVDYALIVIAMLAVSGLIFWRKRRASAPHASVARGGSPDIRNAVRAKIVREADRLWELEAEIVRLAEGSTPAVDPFATDLKRAEAARLRTALEAQCRQHGLTLALVRRRRRSSLVPTAGLTPRETETPSDPA